MPFKHIKQNMQYVLHNDFNELRLAATWLLLYSALYISVECVNLFTIYWYWYHHMVTNCINKIKREAKTAGKNKKRTSSKLSIQSVCQNTSKKKTFFEIRLQMFERFVSSHWLLYYDTIFKRCTNNTWHFFI